MSNRRAVSRSRTLLIPLLAICIACSGCVGRNFDPPPAERLILGVTAPADITSLLGEPFEQRARVIAGRAGPGTAVISALLGPMEPAVADGNYKLLIYTFADAAGAPLIGGTAPGRMMAIEFRNERLFYYCRASSFEADSTNFDEAQIGRIEKGKTSRAEVRAILGDPSGRAVYPEIQLVNGERYIYAYAAMRPRAQKIERKRLDVVFDGAGLVADLRFVANTLPATDFVTAANFSLVMPRDR